MRRRQSLDRLPRRPHFKHVGWAVYERRFAQCRPNDPGRHVEAVILRVHLAGIIFKAPRISRLSPNGFRSRSALGNQHFNLPELRNNLFRFLILARHIVVLHLVR